MNILAAGLLIAAIVVFAVESRGRSLVAIGLALFASAVLVAAVWPQHLIVLN